MAENIESKTLLTVQVTEGNGGKKKTEIRVVDWIVGDKHYPMLEKRETYLMNDEWKTGKAKGFNLKDLGVIQENWDDIISALS